MSARAIVIGTRGSRLALAQAGLVARALEAGGRSSRISIIETAGDRRAPDTAWGEGAFVAAIERALLGGGTLDPTRVFKVREGKVSANEGKVRFQLGLE